MDILNLFFKVNTQQVTQAQQQVTQLGQAAKATAGQASGIGSAFSNLTGASSLVSEAVKYVEDLSKALKGVSLTAAGSGVALGLLAGSMGIIAGLSFAGPLDDIGDLATKLGLSASQAELLKQQLESAGTTTEVYYRGIQKASDFLQNLADGSEGAQRAQKALGLEIDATSDPLKVAQDLAQKYGEQMKEGTLSASEMASLQEVLGKNWREAVVAQNEASDAFKRANDFYEAGIGITKEGSDAASDLEKAQNNLNFIFKSVGSQLVGVVVPAFTTLITALVDSYKSGGLVKGAFDLITFSANLVMVPIRVLIKLFITLETTITSVGKAIGAVFAALATRSTEPLKMLQEDLKNLFDDANDRLAKVGYWSSNENTVEAPAKQSFSGDTVKKAKTGGNGPSDSGVASEIQNQEKALIKLRSEYEGLFGIQAKTNLQQVEAELEMGKYNAKYDERGKLIKKAATEQEIAALKQKASDRDYLESINKKQKAENELWDTAQRTINQENAKATQMRQTNAEYAIQLRVLRQSGATQDDVNIAIAEYNIQQAKTALAIAEMTGATEQEIAVLKNKLAVLKDILGLQQEHKDITDEDKMAKEKQSSFASGWKDAFDKYKESALDAKKNGADVFNKATSLMEDGLTSFLETGKVGFKDFLTGFLKMIEGILVKWAVLNALSYATGGGTVPLSAMFATKQADGGAWSGGVQFFADGGVFDKPTAFGMAGGKIGVMGEAGPEAIMPLTRGSDGKLGVRADGLGATSIQVNTPINITMNGDAGNAADRAQLAKEMYDIAQAAAYQAIRNASRAGGMMNPNK